MLIKMGRPPTAVHLLFLLLGQFWPVPSSAFDQFKRRNPEIPTLGILAPANDKWIFHQKLVAPAVEIAIRKVQNNRLLLPLVRKMTMLRPEDSKCDDLAYATYAALNMFMYTNVTMYLGPVCDFPFAQIARLMQYFDMAVITPGAIHHDFTVDRDKTYRTTTRITAFEVGHFIGMLMKIYKRYEWKQGSIIYIDDAKSEWEVMPKTCMFVADGLANYGKVYTGRRAFPFSTANTRKIESKDDTYIEKLLISNIGIDHAVVVLCADPDSVRKIMKKAYDLNFINGEYVFFNVDLFSSKNQTLRPWYRPNDTEEGNEKARKAYRALLTITLRKPDSEAYKNFSQDVKRLAKENYSYDYGEREVNSFVGAFHDAVLLYALALNDTLTQNKSITDGLVITRNMWNRSFTGITGEVSINARGDRNADYSLLDMNEITGDFEVVANYFGTNKQYIPVPGRTIDWNNPEQKPPPDTPRCGFDGTGCPQEKNELNSGVVAALVMAVLIAVALVVGLFVYRRMKFQAQLQAMNWLIQWDELETKEKRKNKKPQGSTKKSGNAFFHILDKESSGKRLPSMSLFRMSKHENHSLLAADKASLKRLKKEQESNIEAGPVDSDTEPINELNRLRKYSMGTLSSGSGTSLETIAGIQLNQLQNVQMFTRTAFYKGNIVALKRINLRGRRIDFRKTDLLIEVKKIKDLNNDHVVRFIGACVETPNECLVNEYCPKGSLQDVLENDQINLDWMFRLSLMQDICRGMIYLQNNIGPNGNLKSSNCLVDSRFVLKIADFGLYHLRGPKEMSKDEEPYRYYHNLLWTSPELLVMGENAPISGTIKGDVYSFAIVAQEIIYRKGVFYIHGEEPEPREIVDRVAASERPIPFRPSLDSDDCCSEQMVHVVLCAWDEVPEHRPDFAQIKIWLKKLNKSGDSGNILDNLLSRMEQYANNLEGLVAQRTEQYFEEKKKAEDLLYSMLPKSVAGQLIRGEPVTAESYENVTIYFSDICGFTSLSAESTPMQVVQLLNDLYTLFDSIIENFDAYKVETIGDAYMVVSGLPQRNGNLHAREVARMGLAFLAAIFRFRIRHKPNRQLKLRIGINSGPVCAGVVGLKMPRYCLFGDTVNTTSRMESNGAPLRIHISQATKSVLDTFGNFVVTTRGYIEMKGKGHQLTYWLHGENNNIVDPITPSDLKADAAAAAATVTTNTAASTSAAPISNGNGDPSVNSHPLAS